MTPWKVFSNIITDELVEENILELPDSLPSSCNDDRFDKGKIVIFQPVKYFYLKSFQAKFLNKLKLILINNDSASEEYNFERFINDLMLFLYEYIGFDDGKNITYW